MKRALVTGAGGFIGWHLTNYLKSRGYFVRGVDIKEPEFAPSAADEFLVLDLRDKGQAERAFSDKYLYGTKDNLSAGRLVFDEAYCLAADMGGMGFISFHDAEILHNNLLINLNSAEAARQFGAKRVLFTSSACVYPEHLQLATGVAGLCESDAYPAGPDTEYGWEKLIAERVYQAYARDYGLDVRIARFHNVFGPMGTWQGGREKAPAALCRKVAHEVNLLPSGNGVKPESVRIDIWGDGKQTRSFLYIDDCLDGIYALMQSDYPDPVNIGSDRMISISELAMMIAEAAGVKVWMTHDMDKPQGVRGRNSDNTLSKQVLDWEPKISLEDGIARTYAWIAEQVAAAQKAGQS